MLIVNQKKSAFLNLDKCRGFEVVPIGELHKWCISSDGTAMGVYETEERAKEVLRDIAQAYLHGNSSLGSRPVVKNVVYMMPEE